MMVLKCWNDLWNVYVPHVCLLSKGEKDECEVHLWWPWCGIKCRWRYGTLLIHCTKYNLRLLDEGLMWRNELYVDYVQMWINDSYVGYDCILCLLYFCSWSFLENGICIVLPTKMFFLSMLLHDYHN